MYNSVSNEGLTTKTSHYEQQKDNFASIVLFRLFEYFQGYFIVIFGYKVYICRHLQWKFLLLEKSKDY